MPTKLIAKIISGNGISSTLSHANSDQVMDTDIDGQMDAQCGTRSGKYNFWPRKPCSRWRSVLPVIEAEYNDDQSQIPADNNDESQVPVGIEGIEAEETGHDHDWPKGSDDHDGPQGSNDHESPITADRDLQDFELNIDNIEPDKVEATEDDLDDPDDENQQFIDTDINS